MEMDPEHFDPAGEDMNSESACYQCPACHTDEDWNCSNSMRGRSKTRSLSASPALGSTKEFRYEISYALNPEVNRGLLVELMRHSPMIPCKCHPDAQVLHICLFCIGGFCFILDNTVVKVMIFL